VVVHSWKLM